LKWTMTSSIMHTYRKPQQ